MLIWVFFCSYGGGCWLVIWDWLCGYGRCVGFFFLGCVWWCVVGCGCYWNNGVVVGWIRCGWWWLCCCDIVGSCCCWRCCVCGCFGCVRWFVCLRGVGGRFCVGLCFVFCGCRYSCFSWCRFWWNWFGFVSFFFGLVVGCLCCSCLVWFWRCDRRFVLLFWFGLVCFVWFVVDCVGSVCVWSLGGWVCWWWWLVVWYCWLVWLAVGRYCGKSCWCVWLCWCVGVVVVLVGLVWYWLFVGCFCVRLFVCLLMIGFVLYCCYGFVWCWCFRCWWLCFWDSCCFCGDGVLVFCVLVVGLCVRLIVRVCCVDWLSKNCVWLGEYVLCYVWVNCWVWLECSYCVGCWVGCWFFYWCVVGVVLVVCMWRWGCGVWCCCWWFWW